LRNLKFIFCLLSQFLIAEFVFSQQTIKIGVLTDLSGPYADMAGKGSVAAAQMAVKDFIKANPGFKVEVLNADHQNKADIATGIANKWFDQEKVDAIFDLPNSAVALAVQAIAQSKKKITVVSGAATTELTGKSCSPTGFHWTFDAYAMSHGTAQALYQEGAKTWYLLTADYNFGHSMEKEAEDTLTKLGGKILGKLRHPFPSTDFSSFLLQALASKANAVGLANAGADTINAIKQASEIRRKKVQ
jgi:branched-chain amino acid transport system substrate-binding protein